MTLKEILATEKFGNLIAISDLNQKYLVQMIEVMNAQEHIQPYQFYSNWIKNPEYNRVEFSLLHDYSIEKVCGNMTKQFLPSSFLSFKLTDYIRENYKKTINFTESKLLDYTFDLYRELTFICVAMIVNKYRPESLYREHIIFACIQVMFTYFTLYRDKTFLVNLEHVSKVSHEILNSEINVFEELSIKLGFKSYKYVETKIPRTLTHDQIMAFIRPEDSQTDIKKKIMRWCPCGERKARYIMQEYGLTDQKYIRKTHNKELDNEAEQP